jgi:hypothetical protein
METVKRRTINNVATGLTWGHSQDPWRSDSPKQQRSEIARETGGVGSRDFGRAASTGCRRLRRRGSEALEEGAWGRNLLKVSPPLAQPQKNLPLKKRHPIKRLMPEMPPRKGVPRYPSISSGGRGGTGQVMGLNQNNHGFQQCRFRGQRSIVLRLRHRTINAKRPVPGAIAAVLGWALVRRIRKKVIVIISCR